jgi:murein L,D-transpeptidase YafK
MRRLLPLLVFTSLISGFLPSDVAFKQAQLRHQRVREAYAQKEQLLHKWLSDKGMAPVGWDLYIRAFKKEEQLEVWVKEKSQPQYVLLKQYEFCETSGVLGPKQRQGDGQIPEGFYFIDRFNPNSLYHLSLGIDYPNTADKLREKARPGISLGGDIFIHGDCVTIGCIPLTDDKIKEVYLLAVEARAGGQQQIPVHIFPSRLGDAELQSLRKEFASRDGLLAFWANLKPGYDLFESKRQLPRVSVGPQGAYLFNPVK